MANEMLAAAYDTVNPAKAARLRDCATWLTYVRTDSGRKTLYSANFCRVRLCPVCSWRRSLKLFRQVERILVGIQSEKQYKYLLLTLTIRNCGGDQLATTIDHMMLAWNKLTKYDAFARAVKGWYRGLEITHNVNMDSPSYNTYHPHFHVLLAVNSSYFKGNKYLKREDWQSLWMRAAALDYSPQVDVRRVKGNTAKAVAEVAKYPTKDSEYIIPHDWDLTIETVTLLDKALEGRRFAAFGGAFKLWHKRLNLDDIDTGSLLHVDDDEEAAERPQDYISYIWNTGYRQYVSDTMSGE